MDISEKIKIKLDEYLGFNSVELFESADLMLIFGGCIRDIIANQKIHDIDIICASRSCSQLHDLLEKRGFFYMDSLTPKDLSNVYKDIRIINEPHTFVKGDRIVQLIRPAIGYKYTQEYIQHSLDTSQYYRDTINGLVCEVDLSCCGLSYNGLTLIENVKDAVTHCRNLVYEVRKSRMNIPHRLVSRTCKMDERGWSEISGTMLLRDSKINTLLDISDDINYIFEKIYSSDAYSIKI